MRTEFEGQSRRSPQEYSSMELGMMYNSEAPCPNLQSSFIASQEYSRERPFGIFDGKIPLMEEVGKDFYNGWVVNAFAPGEFWLTRRQQIIDGNAPDVFIFVPVVPDWQNIIKHPRAVLKAIREEREARKKNGNDFSFVFTKNPNGEGYIKDLYVFFPRKSILSIDKKGDT